MEAAATSLDRGLNREIDGTTPALREASVVEVETAQEASNFSSATSAHGDGAIPVAIMALLVTGMTSLIHQSHPIARKKFPLKASTKKLAESSTWKLPPPVRQA